MFLIGCLELAFMAGGIFQHERKWKTLSSLAMLPISTRKLAYQKIRGCLAALIPVTLYFTVGLICVGDDLFDIFSDLLEGRNSSWEIVLAFFYVLSSIILFLHIVVWLSLYLKRGALPVAIGADIVLHMFVGIVLAAITEGKPALVTLTVASLIASLVLHVKIGTRIDELAAEE